MTRKSIIDTAELIKRTEQYVNQWAGNYKLLYSERKKWGEVDKQRWKNAKANVYARMRAENKDKTRNFWLKQVDNGAFKAFFNKYGLTIYGDKVRFANCGSPILTAYLKNVVLPALETEMKIKGITLKHANYNTGLTNDLFSWEHAELM